MVGLALDCAAFDSVSKSCAPLPCCSAFLDSGSYLHNMASRLPKLDLNDNESALAWLDIFEASCRHGEIDKKAQRDYFISLVDIDAYLKIKTIVAPKDVSAMEFTDIKKILKDYLTPRKKLIIAERARFFEAKQLDGESAGDYLQRLRKISQYCDFDNLRGEEDIVKLKFISGLRDCSIKQKILEANIAKELNLNDSVELVKSIEQISSFANPSADVVDKGRLAPYQETNEIDALKFSADRMITDCRFCGRNHRIRKCPAWGKRATNVARKITSR